MDVTYLLPIRADEPPDAEMTAYLRTVSEWCRLVVVDGSPAPVFDAAHDAWSAFAIHVAPLPAHRCANGKVAGVLTGLAYVETPVLVIADDDVRYTRAGLEACVDALEGADLVRPQNYFDPLAWHARWDTARTLLNRMTGGDFPGTLVVRTLTLHAAGGYDGDVLFENLELMRTIEAVGGRCVVRSDLYVARRPPTTGHFLGQRVRQAYDEFARPGRMLVWLSVVPAALLAWRRCRWAITAVVGASVVVAELGRRRHGGSERFPATAALLAPAWIIERGVCSWLAVGSRLCGGVRYGDGRILRAASSPAALRQASSSVVVGTAGT